MTYHEITKKLKDLTMTPADWKWLDEYMNGPKDKLRSWTPEYHDIVMAYQERERGKLPICDTDFGLCRYCGYGFKCGYKGFCSHQRKAN